MADLDLPILDLSALAGPHAPPSTVRDTFDQALHASLARWGFVGIAGHGIDPDLLDRAYATAKAFFRLPGPAKRAWERAEDGRQRGYTGFGVERARDQGVHDLKEFFQVGRTLGPEHEALRAAGMPDAVWPDDPPSFRPVFEALFGQLDQVAATLLAAIARGAGLDVTDLLEGTHHGSNVLRVIHYPPLRPTDPPDAVRAAAHEDINLLTLLPVSTAPGLQLLDRDGTWRSLVTPPDVLICDTGDLMAYLSGGRLPATTHRVVNPRGAVAGSRYSLPFFVHPRPEWVLRPVDGSGPPRSAGELLRARLIENGVLATG